MKIWLSLFDGMSCGQIALERANIKVDRYYSSENDKYAITVAQANYPNTIQLGNVIKLRRYLEKPELYERMLETSFVKQENKDLIWHCIDIFLNDVEGLIGGSPCQGFSFAGKQLNFDDPRSKLFFEFVKIKEILNPKYFLLENVRMKKEYQDVISKYMGVEPIEINSALVSAQNRKRLYWSNIEGVEQPEDKGIYLQDITFDSSKFSYLVARGNNSGGLRSVNGKIGTVTSNSWEQNNFCVTFTERRTEEAKKIRKEVMKKTGKDFSPRRAKNMVRRKDSKSNCLTTSITKEHLLLDFKKLIHSKKALEYIEREVRGGRNHWDFKHHSGVRNEKSATIVVNFLKGVPYNVLKDWDCIRKFHPIECERLQTVPDNYTNHVSDTQRYKMIGNGWTISVIAHILSHIDK